MQVLTKLDLLALYMVVWHQITDMFADHFWLWRWKRFNLVDQNQSYCKRKSGTVFFLVYGLCLVSCATWMNYRTQGLDEIQKIHQQGRHCTALPSTILHHVS